MIVADLTATGVFPHMGRHRDDSLRASDRNEFRRMLSTLGMGYTGRHRPTVFRVGPVLAASASVLGDALDSLHRIWAHTAEVSS